MLFGYLRGMYQARMAEIGSVKGTGFRIIESYYIALLPVVLVSQPSFRRWIGI